MLAQKECKEIRYELKKFIDLLPGDKLEKLTDYCLKLSKETCNEIKEQIKDTEEILNQFRGV